MSRRPIPSQERGHVLLEALIASAIIAAMLGLTYDSLLTTTRAEQSLREKRAALPVAQSLLARVGADIAATPGSMSGSSDGYDWNMDITPYAETEGRSVDGPPVLDVRVNVRSPATDRPMVQLRTLRLGA